MKEISGYKFFWNVENNEGIMHLHTDDGNVNFTLDSPQEASLLIDVLRNEKPVYYDPAGGIVMTGMEPVGEGEG